MATRPLLALHHATLLRGDARVLDNLTFEIREGEHTAILGPNGSGKSSLIRLLNRQDYPQPHPDGSAPIQIFGQARWDVFDLRARLGIVSADLHRTFTTEGEGGLRSGREVVLSGFFASQRLFSHQQVTSFMHEGAGRALAHLGALHLADKPIEEMSTGEARRILIARALVHEPQALLLDEPTTGLDVVARHQLLQILGGLARQGRTILLVTHHIEEILPEIQRVILLRAGRVFMDGPKQEVLTPARLSALYGLPINLQQHNGCFFASCGVS